MFEINEENMPKAIDTLRLKNNISKSFSRVTLQRSTESWSVNNKVLKKTVSSSE